MNFPSSTRTKADAQQLAVTLFPGWQLALHHLKQTKPDTTHPLYQATHDTADQLRGVLFWLHEQKPKIYKRARWHLFYDVATRAIRQADDLAQEKVRAIYAEQRAQDWQRHHAAQTMTGDGHGI